MHYKTYVDESGNTGDKLTDKIQKFFMLGAVSVPETRIQECSTVLTACFNAVKEKEEEEIKATKWVKSPKKSEAMKAILECLINAGSEFSLVLIEKRYMISAIIVDNFMDGAYNDTEDYTWVNNSTEKKLAAQYFYTVLSDEDIERVFQAFRSPNFDELKLALDIVVAATDYEVYKTMLCGTYNHLQELYDEDTVTIDDMGSGVGRSPNYTGFVALGGIIAKTMRAQSSTTDILFDHCNQFDDAYVNLFGIFKKASIPMVVEKMIGLTSWKELITDFNVDNSKADPLIQSADILATSSLKTLQKAFVGKYNSWTAYDDFIRAMVFLMLRQDKLVYVMSEQYIDKMVDCFKRILPDHE